MDYPIKIDGLGKTFGSWFKPKFCAVKNLSLEVPEGTVFGFLGRNGAGKTTTVKTVLGLLKPTAGSVLLMGKDPTDPASREGVSYLPELPNVDPLSTPREFLRFIGKICRMDKARIKERTEQVLTEVGLADRIDTPCGQFSRGTKQRVELAQALLPEPKLMILDEPLAGLDPIGRKEVRELLRRYNKETGCTIFMSSHILTDVETICDWGAVLDQGELKALGELEQLLEAESIEVSGRGLRPEGIMFIEKMGEHTAKNRGMFSVFLKPNSPTEKVERMFAKYGATDVTTVRHCRSLEDFFVDVTGNRSAD